MKYPGWRLTIFGFLITIPRPRKTKCWIRPYVTDCIPPFLQLRDRCLLIDAASSGPWQDMRTLCKISAEYWHCHSGQCRLSRGAGWPASGSRWALTRSFISLLAQFFLSSCCTEAKITGGILMHWSHANKRKESNNQILTLFLPAPPRELHSSVSSMFTKRN